MAQQKQTAAADTLKAIASALMQVRNLSDDLARHYRDDWQFDKLVNISNGSDEFLNDIALLIGHETINEL